MPTIAVEAKEITTLEEEKKKLQLGFTEYLNGKARASLRVTGSGVLWKAGYVSNADVPCSQYIAMTYLTNHETAKDAYTNIAVVGVPGLFDLHR